MAKVKMNQTLDRRRGYLSPSEANFLCPYFKERFFQWGAVDKVAVCELDNDSITCDYRDVQEDGTRICVRYDYVPLEIVEDANPIDDLPSLPYLLANPIKRLWFSKQYVDTHQKVWAINGGELGWHQYGEG